MKQKLALALVFVVGSVFGQDITLDYQGRRLVLHDDHTWQEVALPTGTPSGTVELTKHTNQTQVLNSSNGRIQVSFDPTVWEQNKPSNASAEFGFYNKSKTGFAVLIYDGLQFTLESMEKILVTNAKNIDPNARILEKQDCRVNGTLGELVTYTATGSGITFTLITFVATGEFGSVQYTFYTTAAAFPNLRDEFLAAISGIEFVP